MKELSMKQTAVEYLIEQLSNYDSKMIELFGKEINQAKEMEKQQIIEAWIDGNDSEPKETTGHYAEQYYTETYNYWI